jgi:hypothetical protein
MHGSSPLYHYQFLLNALGRCKRKYILFLAVLQPLLLYFALPPQEETATPLENNITNMSKTLKFIDRNFECY